MKGVGKPWRFTVDDYYAMAEAGILTHDERVELINGEIIPMSPIGSRHAYSVNWITRLLITLLGERAWVSSQNPLHLNGQAEPEPDVLLLRWRDDAYVNDHPGPADVLLLIEVADTSLDRDRGVKLSMYAEAGIPETWIVNIPERSVEAHTDPHQRNLCPQPRVRFGRDCQPYRFPGRVPKSRRDTAGMNLSPIGISMTDLSQIKALTFDVGGTVFDWRGTIEAEVSELARQQSADSLDVTQFATDWRRGMFAMLARVQIARDSPG